MGNLTALEEKPSQDTFRLPPIAASSNQPPGSNPQQKSAPLSQTQPERVRDSLNTAIFGRFLLPAPSTDPSNPQKAPSRLQVHMSRLVFRLELSQHLKSTFRGRLYFGWADRSSMFLAPSLLAPAYVWARYRLRLGVRGSLALSFYIGASYFVFCGYYLTQKEFFSWMCKDHPLAEFGRRQYLIRFGEHAEAWGQVFAEIERERLLQTVVLPQRLPQK